MSNFGKILSFFNDSAEAVKEKVLKTDYYSVRLIKIPGATSTYVNPLQSSNITNILLNGKCVDKETRCLYLFYIDTFFQAAWIIEVQIDTRTQTVVYYDRLNNIGFDRDHKIYNPRVVHGRIIWTDNFKNIYQMDIERAKKSFLYGIGYDPYPITTEWNDITLYNQDQIVSRGPAFYKCLIANSGNNPSVFPSYWSYLCPLENAYYSMNVENFYFAPKPPLYPPVVTYKTDDTRKINNLKQTLFQFAYNYIYLDYRESTYSPACVVPLPNSEEEVATGLANEMVSINNLLNISVNTGGEEVRKVRIIARSSVDPSTWFLVDEINKFADAESVISSSQISGQVTPTGNQILNNVELNILTISVPLPIVQGYISSVSDYGTITLNAENASGSSFYVVASVDDMSWFWDGSI